MGGLHNANTAWLNYKGAWAVFIIGILFARLLTSLIGLDTPVAWTVINVLHAALTLHFFHFVRGGAEDDVDGKYDDFTWWEQIDGGAQYTSNRKFFTLVPCILFLIAYHYTSHLPNQGLCRANLVASVIIIMAKTPFMHRKRIMGYNRAPVFDDLPGTPRDAAANAKKPAHRVRRLSEK